MQHINVKIFAREADIRLGDAIPVFHRWIQDRACEEMLVSAALEAERNNRTRAAARLGINVRTIYKKLCRDEDAAADPSGRHTTLAASKGAASPAASRDHHGDHHGDHRADHHGDHSAEHRGDHRARRPPV